MNNDYTIVKKLTDKVEELDKKIDNIGDDNIVGHSTVDDINGLIKDINKDIKKVNIDELPHFLTGFTELDKAIKGLFFCHPISS